MNDEVKILRVVVASPSDVGKEREIVSSVVDDLNGSIASERHLRLEASRWETDAWPGFHAAGPQGLIDPVLRIEDCAILVGIFWKRFGTPVSDAGSGTEHEIRKAIAAWNEKRRPEIMIYFSQKPHAPQSREETDQWGQVLAFRSAFPKEGLWWPYRGPLNFERLLRRHLTNYLINTYPIEESTTAASPAPRRSPGPGNAYFAVQAKIVDEHAADFTGRGDVLEAFENFRRTHTRGYFLVCGGPGQGKTALACHLVRTLGCAHHFINATGGRAEPRLILRSLLAQLEDTPREAGASDRNSTAELTKAFDEALAAASRERKQIIVIDALDEVGDEMTADPPYLPDDTLPDGTFVVVTSRPGDHLNRLQERLFAVPYELYDLGPLTLGDIERIIVRVSPGVTAAQIGRIAEASQGNPLYVHAAAVQLAENPQYDLTELPKGIEGFFRSATRALRMGNAVLGDVLALFSVARTPLTMRDLSAITGVQQRPLYEGAIRPVQQFLLQTDGAYTFYHASFHDFVRRSLLYDDELREAHQQLAAWLNRPEMRHEQYRFDSLAHHLFESGMHQVLTEIVDAAFLSEGVQRLGYDILETLELLTKVLLQARDPALIDRCVSLVETVRAVVGGDIVTEINRSVHPFRSGPQVFRTKLIEPRAAGVTAVDVYVGMLPKTEVPADFFELVPVDQRLVAAIGDAPAAGLKSAFVARFIANVFHDLVEQGVHRDLSSVLSAIDEMVKAYDYFKRISMQCIAIDPKRGIIRMANAGHPYPVHYSRRTGNCDILPLAGDVLHRDLFNANVRRSFEDYAVEIGPGDVFVLLTDGLTEGHILHGEPYGYRFIEIMKRRSDEAAKAIGRAILDDWRAHPRGDDVGDDVTVVTIKIAGEERPR